MTLAACNEESEEDQAPYSRFVSNGLAWDSENLEVCKQETAVSRKSKFPHQANCYKTENADHRTKHAISKDKVGVRNSFKVNRLAAKKKSDTALLGLAQIDSDLVCDETIC